MTTTREDHDNDEWCMAEQQHSPHTMSQAQMMTSSLFGPGVCILDNDNATTWSRTTTMRNNRTTTTTENKTTMTGNGTMMNRMTIWGNQPTITTAQQHRVRVRKSKQGQNKSYDIQNSTEPQYNYLLTILCNQYKY